MRPDILIKFGQNPIEWWNNKQVSNAIKDFSKKALNLHKDSLDIWSDFLKNVEKILGFEKKFIVLSKCYETFSITQIILIKKLFLLTKFERLV